MASDDVLTRIKVCGLCAPEDADLARTAGAEYVGVILAGASVRRQPWERALEILDAAPGAQRVGVFVDAPAAELMRAGAALRLDVLQLHGEETPMEIEAVRAAGAWSIWKALRPRAAAEFLDALDRWRGHVDGILVDGWSDRGAGGTGTRFDWSAIAPLRTAVPGGVTFIAAGGLRPENVGEAVRLMRPDIVDVSSGVEDRPGRKSPERMRAFIAAARLRSSGAGRPA